MNNLKVVRQVSKVVNLALVLCGLGCSALSAATNTVDVEDIPELVTLEFCLSRSLSLAEERGLFRSELAYARSDITAARSRSLPHLNVVPDVRYYTDSSEIEAAVSADLGQHFLEIPQNRLHNRIARRNVERARCLETGLRIRRNADVIRAYIDALKSEKELEVAAMAESAAEAAAAAWRRMHIETGPIAEQREAAVIALQNARAKTVQAELLYNEMRRELAVLCDIPEDNEFRMEKLPGFVMPPATLGECLSWAAAHHSDLAGAEHEAETTEMMVRLARMGRLPTAGLSFGYSDRGQDEFDDTESGAYGAVHLRIPIWDAGETKANVQRLQARREALRVDARRLEAELKKNIASAFLAMKQAFISLQSIQSDPKPEREFLAAEVLFRNGELSSVAFETSKLAWARHNAMLAYRNWDCYRARAELLEAIQATSEQLSDGLRNGSAGTGTE